MDHLELIESAAKKVGGISELARQMEWHKGAIALIKQGKRPLPPYRAAQMARLLERDEKAAYLGALADQSDGHERTFWLGELRERGCAIIAMLTLLAALSAAALHVQKPHGINGVRPSADNIHYAPIYGRLLLWLAQSARQFWGALCRTTLGVADQMPIRN